MRDVCKITFFPSIFKIFTLLFSIFPFSPAKSTVKVSYSLSCSNPFPCFFTCGNCHLGSTIFIQLAKCFFLGSLIGYQCRVWFHRATIFFYHVWFC